MIPYGFSKAVQPGKVCLSDAGRDVHAADAVANFS